MDIVTEAGVPRYLHNNLPLGNPLGAPGDRVNQRRSIESALLMAKEMEEPGIKVSELTWPRENWQKVYARVGDDNRDTLLRMGEENRRKRAENKAKGLTR